MAIGVTEAVAEVADTSNATSYAFGAFTPTANSFLVVILAALSTVIDNGVSGGSLVWTRQYSLITTNVIAIYTAPVGGSPGSTTITFDCTGDAAAGCSMTCHQFTGQNVGNEVSQVASSTVGAGGTPTLVFGTALNTSNGYCAQLGNSDNPANVVHPASWTESADTGFNSPTTGLEAAFRAGGESGTTITWGGTTVSAARTVGIEVNAVGIGGGQPAIKRVGGVQYAASPVSRGSRMWRKATSGLLVPKRPALVWV